MNGVDVEVTSGDFRCCETGVVFSDAGEAVEPEAIATLGRRVTLLAERYEHSDPAVLQLTHVGRVSSHYSHCQHSPIQGHLGDIPSGDASCNSSIRTGTFCVVCAARMHTVVTEIMRWRKGGIYHMRQVWTVMDEVVVFDAGSCCN